MEIIKETADYKLVVLPEEMREEKDANYGIIHKEYGTIEAMFGVLYAGLEIIDELQTKLDEISPKKTATLTSIQ